MIRGDDEAAFRRHVLDADETDPPCDARDDADRGPQNVQEPLRRGARLGRLSAARALVGRVRRLRRFAQNESPAPPSLSDSAGASCPSTLFHASLMRETTLADSSSPMSSPMRDGFTPSSDVTLNSSHHSGMSRSPSASSFQRSQRTHSKPVYARASSFVSASRVRAPHA